MNDYIFSYGTLQKERTQTELFGRILQGFPDILYGYKISTIEIVDEVFLSRGEEKYQHTLIPSGEDKDFVNGTILELTQDELLKVDEYEPRNFQRVKVRLKSGKEAWIYMDVTIQQNGS